jgi:alkyl sulfatase BDS1-like metallo-beta-lactamase superfamily hydrolase
LRTLFDARAAGDLAATYELRLGDQTFRASVSGGELELERGEAPEADATIASDPWPLGGMLWQGYRLEDAERAGEVSVEGDRHAAKRFLGLFPLPEAAPTA